MPNEEYSLTDELERKTMDALSRVLADYEQGAISQPSAAVALRTLFDATSGLLSGECFNLLSEASKMVSGDGVRFDLVRRFFIHENGEFALIEYQYGEAVITLRKGKRSGDGFVWARESRATFDDQPNPFEVAKERFDGYAQSMVRLGFKELK
jgi:hypothetical protein